MRKRPITIGTRASTLALWQANHVKDLLDSKYPQLEINLEIIKTKGDKILDTALSKIGDKGLFTREIEEQLLAGNIDMAVHSLKDLPTTLPTGLTISAISKRNDPADALVSKNDLVLSELPQKATILTSSLRRASQLLNIRKDINIKDVRGNVQTRLRKLDESDADAIILAAAGLNRLELSGRISQILEPKEFLPACGQGALAIETRIDDTEIISMLNCIEDTISRINTTAERTLLAELEGGCQIPIGAYAWQDNNHLHLSSIIGSLDGTKLLKKSSSIPMPMISDAIDSAKELGIMVARELLAAGGKDILNSIRQ